MSEITEEKVTEALESIFDGVDKFDLVQKILELEAELDLLKSETAHSMVMCKCTKSYKLPSEKVCKVCTVRTLEAANLALLATMADMKEELAASKTEANDLRVRVEGLLLEIEGR